MSLKMGPLGYALRSRQRITVREVSFQEDSVLVVDDEGHRFLFLFCGDEQKKDLLALKPGDSFWLGLWVDPGVLPFRSKECKTIEPCLPIPPTEIETKNYLD